MTVWNVSNLPTTVCPAKPQMGEAYIKMDPRRFFFTLLTQWYQLWMIYFNTGQRCITMPFALCMRQETRALWVRSPSAITTRYFVPTVHSVFPSNIFIGWILPWQTLFGPKYLLGALPSVLSLMWDQVSHSYRAAGKVHTWQLCVLGSTNLQLHNLVLPWGKCFRLVRIIKLTVRVRSLMRIKDMHLPACPGPDLYQDTAILPSQRTGSMCKVPSTSLTDSGTCASDLYLSYYLFTRSWRCNTVLPAGQRLQPHRDGSAE